ncbi:DUF2970 domain-containing protein [Cobetia sp. L2A1]|uniref:DUF2970 domain-containing protein n=1 Tax=Cobetia sp. L2A1 TaxID=2686360 RepID=UPI00131ABE9F|nr:DUF2970 domain-containing protein [Cobetia sp. L2A1]
MINEVKSVLAAFIGVQKEANRKRDFEQGHLLDFVVIGLVMAALLVGGMALLATFIAG